MTSITPNVYAVTGAGLAPTPSAVPLMWGQSEVQYAAVDASSAGANVLVDAVPARKIRVLSLVLVASGGTNTVQLAGPASNPLLGAVDLASDGQFVLPYNPAGWGETLPGEAVLVVLSDARTVAGVVDYVTIPVSHS